MDNFGNILDPVLDNFRDTVGGFHVGAHGHFQLDANHALVLLRHDFHRHVVGGHIAHEKEHGNQGEHLEQHSRNGKAERQGFQIYKADAVEGSGEQPENASHHGGFFFDNVSVLVFLFALEQIGRQKRGQGKGGEQGHQGGKHHGKTEGTEEAQLIYSENTKAEELNTEMVKNRDKEIRLGQTYVGPHRDDIAFMINGKEVKKYGSQGQQRSISLSLKLSEIEMVRELTGENPVLLLDDVLSELDRKRQEQLLSGISDIQTLITCTGVDEFVRDNFHIGHAWNVKSGTVTGGIYGQ